jgi:hypothetical protein
MTESNTDKLVASRTEKRGMRWIKPGGNGTARMINLEEPGDLRSGRKGFINRRSVEILAQLHAEARGGRADPRTSIEPALKQDRQHCMLHTTTALGPKHWQPSLTERNI